MYQTPTKNPARPRKSRNRKRRSNRRGLAVSVELAIAAVLALGVFIGLLAAGGSGRPIEIAILVIALAVGGSAGWPASGHAALGAAAAYLIVETLAGRLDGSHLGAQLLLTAGLLGSVLAAGYARGERQAQPAKQQQQQPPSPLPRAAPQPEAWKVEPWIQEPLRSTPRLKPGSLDYELQRAKRMGRPVSVLAIRPDGNAAGQTPKQMLDLIEDAVAGTTRSVDLVNRSGQSRFEVILPDTDAEGARTLAERIRLRIDSTRPQPDSGISVSIGVSSYPADGSDDVELAAAAGRALERAAELGGNRTVLYSVPEGSPRGWGLR
jgi:diguanylate cyclase (GGDEF)-like protein